MSTHSGPTATSTASTDESRNLSSGPGGSHESVASDLPRYHGGPKKIFGRLSSMPIIRDPKFIWQQVLGRCRTDAEIVEDIEDEIQQRISKRKQQLVEKAGGAQHHSRLQERAMARSTGGRLKQALTEMHNSRTTAELLQIASERKSSIVSMNSSL